MTGFVAPPPPPTNQISLCWQFKVCKPWTVIQLTNCCSRSACLSYIYHSHSQSVFAHLNQNPIDRHYFHFCVSTTARPEPQNKPRRKVATAEKNRLTLPDKESCIRHHITCRFFLLGCLPPSIPTYLPLTSPPCLQYGYISPLSVFSRWIGRMEWRRMQPDQASGKLKRRGDRNLLLQPSHTFRYHDGKKRVGDWVLKRTHTGPEFFLSWLGLFCAICCTTTFLSSVSILIAGLVVWRWLWWVWRWLECVVCGDDRGDDWDECGDDWIEFVETK